jgi:hypothetical protein
MAGEDVGHSLQATALVNEAYIRLVDGKVVAWKDHAHFLAVCARVMRHVLADHARAKNYQKRGGEAARVTLDEALVVSKEPVQDFEALDEVGDTPGAALMKSYILARRVGIALMSSEPKRAPNPGCRASMREPVPSTTID